MKLFWNAISGQHGLGQQTGKPLCYKGSTFHCIIKGLYAQVNTIAIPIYIMSLFGYVTFFSQVTGELYIYCREVIFQMEMVMLLAILFFLGSFIFPMNFKKKNVIQWSSGSGGESIYGGTFDGKWHDAWSVSLHVFSLVEV